MSDLVRNYSLNTTSFTRTNNSKLTAFNANAVADNTIASCKYNSVVDAFGRSVSCHDNSALAEAARFRTTDFMAALKDYESRTYH